MDQIPEPLQKQFAQLQQLQQQGEMVATQRAQLEMAVNELQATLKELEGLTDKETLYRSVGSILMKVKSRTDLTKKLEEEKETNELRVKSLKRQEELIKEQLTQLSGQLQNQVATLQGGGGLPGGGPLGSS